IGSANMFDILPSSAVPPNAQLPKELNAAKETSREIFKQLTQSPERDSVLAALGRVGKSSLKQKIRHRAQFLIEAVGERFPEIITVTDEAVNCRNHYVHGSEPRFDYSDNFGTVIFFTDTLEFVFAASELIEAGWDVKAWSEIGTTMSHPFARYCVNYAENLRKLKALLARPVATS
ncbi:MAG: HEPN domain-containing protein, partial [Candidatus Binatia bacterium]